MTTPRPPQWLATFQESFSQTLRAPLESSSGTFQANPSAQRGFLVYNRQYWFRLFSALQSEYPLTAHVVGYWAFNHYAQAFLMRHPPWHVDLARAADGFLQFVVEAGDEIHIPRQTRRPPREALLQSVSIDNAWRQVFQAPEQTPWQATADDAARLPKLRLEPAETFALVEENWPLVTLRHALSRGEVSDGTPFPSRLGCPQSWVIVRTEEGIQQIQLAPLQARLFKLLLRYPLEEALVRLEQGVSSDELEILATHMSSWFTQTMRLGFWKGARL